ncbi:galactose oxidase [Gigaspora margarita]|uniref:Galactose oxidase n=1 Tax=Gigaspora margarita TaxID=4874 RepID=A0A8H4A063_GIGMA|nr:galactose oxidase [Gigaspora margarita]
MMRFILLFIINCYIGGINAFVPLPRAEVTANLVNNRIYFNGGWNGSLSSDFFYLDVLAPFITNNITSMPWTDLSSIPNMAYRTAYAACINGTNIIYIGGSLMKETDSNFISAFDVTTQKWSMPVTSGNLTSIERHFIHCVSSRNKIYVYGGNDDVLSMIRLDVSNLIWSTFSGIMAPFVPVGYSATLLNDTSILYIGGGTNLRSGAKFSYLSLDKLPLYNINDNTWSLVAASGIIPSPRIDHGAVFIPQYNQILMFYGSRDTSIWALDTLKFVWSVASISNIGGSPTSLFSFASTLVGAYILIGFGRSNDSTDLVTNDFFLLDVSQKDNYKWVTTFDPTKQLQSFQPSSTTSPSSPPSNSSSNSSNNSPNNIATIIGSIFGVLAGLIVLITIAVLIIKRYGHSSYPALVTSQDNSGNQPIPNN